MNTVCPSEERLKSLIMEAFDELSAPDPARIGQIASTLANKTKKRRRPQQQWLFWLLLGGSITAAAWWGSGYLLPKPVETPVQIKLEKTESVSPETSSEIAKEPKESSVTNHSNSKVNPIIDQREQY